MGFVETTMEKSNIEGDKTLKKFRKIYFFFRSICEWIKIIYYLPILIAGKCKGKIMAKKKNQCPAPGDYSNNIYIYIPP